MVQSTWVRAPRGREGLCTFAQAPALFIHPQLNSFPWSRTCVASFSRAKAMAAPKSVAGIMIYAELLPNIRQVSVGAALPSPPDVTTFAEVFEGGRRLCISHQACSEVVDLPATVTTSAALAVPKAAGSQLSWRLPVSAAEASALRSSPESQAVPWSSLDLKAGSPVSCRECGSCFVHGRHIEAWQDLPSENWAEMMEFWHCHKPHDHGNNEHEGLASRAYGANSTITARPGVGFVDITLFMFSESDCTNLLVSFIKRPAFQLDAPLPSSSIGEREGDQPGALSHSMAWSPIQFPKSEHVYRSRSVGSSPLVNPPHASEDGFADAAEKAPSSSIQIARAVASRRLKEAHSLSLPDGAVRPTQQAADSLAYAYVSSRARPRGRHMSPAPRPWETSRWGSMCTSSAADAAQRLVRIASLRSP